MTHYRHTQVGRVPVIIVATVLALFIAATVQLPAGPPRYIFISASVLLVVIGVLFTSITTVVTDEELLYFHGPGLWRMHAKLEDIVEVLPVRNKWWYGFGIRYTPHGWLFNTWGLDAVEVHLTTGRTFRVGTDEPKELVEAIERVK